MARPWADVLDTLDHLGVDRFVLAGNSLGALAGLRAAVTAPEQVEGVVLVGYRPHDQATSPRLLAAWDAEWAALAAGGWRRPSPRASRRGPRPVPPTTYAHTPPVRSAVSSPANSPTASRPWRRTRSATARRRRAR
ncbi:alpha/beta fold hydrolase [Streptomyces varsoviensis]|uniref:alpha/beta fold hydrolase n=1 Tax=Streptomyces varsoviensis TaxID=67373 RepID=UPI00068CA571|nr:alpha/beta hydrolase [Streptomyces varsoviensis]